MTGVRVDPPLSIVRSSILYALAALNACLRYHADFANGGRLSIRHSRLQWHGLLRRQSGAAMRLEGAADEPSQRRRNHSVPPLAHFGLMPKVVLLVGIGREIVEFAFMLIEIDNEFPSRQRRM